MNLLNKQTILEAESFNSVAQPTSHTAALSWQFARTTLRSIDRLATRATQHPISTDRHKKWFPTVSPGECI